MDDRNIFLEALNHSTPEERAAYLSEACGNDAELRQRVELLLAAHEDAGSFLEKSPEELMATLGHDHEIDLDSWKDVLSPNDNDESLGMLGRYEVLELIGRGGMGVVFSARDPQLNRVVAIKMLVPELAANAVSVRRFLREAQAAAAVSHDHVITIHAVDEQAKPPLIVMELIAGQSLQEKIDKQGPLDVKSILRIGMQTAAGLAAAHKQGLIHRDIKPSNILLENGIERVKLTDFGLARAVDDIGMTRTGQITGTPQYMSPEQAQGHAIDHRTDLFSLGCVLYAMCTGRAAFRAESAVAVMHRLVHENPRPIREMNEDIPDWMCRIVDKLMEKDPDRRFTSANEVEDLLGRHLAHLQQPASVPQPALIQPTRPTSSHDLRPSRPVTGTFLEFCLNPQPEYAKQIWIPTLILFGVWLSLVTAAMITNAPDVVQAVTLGAGFIVIPAALMYLSFSAWHRARNESSFDSSSLIDADLASASRTFLAVGLASLVWFVLTFLALSNDWLRHPLSALVVVSGSISLPVGLLAMNAYWDLPRRIRYWWVYAAALAAVFPWNPFLLLALPWTVRTLRTLNHSEVEQQFVDVANPTFSGAGPTASESLSIESALFWDNYKRTRWVIVLMSMAIAPVWLTIAVIETITFGPSGEIWWRSPFLPPGVLSEWLMCFQSIVLIFVCAGYFGRGQAALVTTLVLDAVCVFASGSLASYIFGMHFPGFNAVWLTTAILLLIPAAALFFVTYLLIRTLQNSADQQELAGVANSTQRSADSTTDKSLSTGNTLSEIFTARRFLAAGFFLILAFSIWGIAERFDYLGQRQMDLVKMGRLIVKTGYEDVTVRYKGPGYSATSYHSHQRSLPPGDYTIIALRSLGDGKSAYYVGNYTIQSRETILVELEQQLARPGISDFEAIEPFLADGPEIATLHITVDDPEVQLSINGVDWDIAGEGAQTVPLKPGRYGIVGMKDGAEEFQQQFTLKAGDEKLLELHSASTKETLPVDGTVASPETPGTGNPQAKPVTADWKLLLSEAASISLNEWNTLSGDIKGPPTAAVRGEPLSLVLLNLNPFTAAKDNEKVAQDFWYLTETLPRPRAIGAAIAISRDKGYVSFLQPGYITNFETEENGDSAVGYAGFTVPKLYSGRVEFKASRQNATWTITELTLPNYGITLRRDDKVLWQREISSVTLRITFGQDGEVRIQSNPVDWADLDQTLRDTRRSMGKQPVTLKIHPDVPYEKVSELLDLVKKHYSDSELRVSTE